MDHPPTGEQTLMRIFFGERDRCLDGPRKGHPLHEALVQLFREREFAGATVFRGQSGFGAGARLRTDRLLELSLDLPMVVEVVETEDQVRSVLPDLDRMMGAGLVTLEKVSVALHRPEKPPKQEREQHRIEGLRDE